MYPAELVAPMKQDLVNAGFEQLVSPVQVDEVIANTAGTLLLVVNSVCGCAAGNMRPGVKLSLNGDKKPTKLFLNHGEPHQTDALRQRIEYELGWEATIPKLNSEYNLE
jgi:putative YphP/YqiW family bacilliredoxin